MAEIASVVPELDAPGPGTGESAEGGVSKPSKKEGARPPLSTFKTYVNLVTVVIGAGIMAPASAPCSKRLGSQLPDSGLGPPVLCGKRLTHVEGLHGKSGKL